MEDKQKNLKEIDLLVVGGGTAGAGLVGIIGRDTDLRVVLLEAGPDYNRLNENCWPQDLLDARELPYSHDWGYAGVAHRMQSEPMPFHRARVIGGCSSHNNCIALVGHRRDYDRWAELGNFGWEWASVQPAFERAKHKMRIHIPQVNELTPYHLAFVEGATSVGIPRVADLNNPEEVEGVGSIPVNIAGGIRWNSAFAYLDAVRNRANLTIIADARVDRVLVQDGRARAVEAIIGGQRQTIVAERIILSAGAYGSPSILLRSGIGPPAALRALGIKPIHELPGVGKNLTDHPFVHLRFGPTSKLEQQMTEFEAHNWMPATQALAKLCSPRCHEAFDLHLLAGRRRFSGSDEWHYSLTVAALAPRSTGSVELSSDDPDDPPLIDHGYLSDPESSDLGVLIDGIQLGREVMALLVKSGWLTGEITPGPAIKSRDQLAGFVQRSFGSYAHPACTLRMGPASDPMSVVDPSGKVHGIESLYVCDASIFPVMMRANTNLPTAMLAEHLAQAIVGIS